MLRSSDSSPESANNRLRLQSPLACHFTTGVLLGSGRIIYRSGLNPGRVVTAKVTVSVETRR